MATTNPSSTNPHSAASTGPSWLWLALIPLFAGIPFLFRPAATAEQEELETRRRRIENMSAPERERLDRNFAQFQQLSEERKNALREIDEVVRQDEELESTLLAYESWLNTLTPWERAELRNASTLDEKVAYASTIAAARRQEAIEIAERDKEWEEWVKRYLTNFQPPGQRPGGRSRVTETDVSNMMAVLEADYGSRVKPNPTVPAGRAAYHIQLLAEALKASIEQNGLEAAREKPLSDKTVQEMLDQISHSDVRKLFEDYDAKRFVNYLAGKLEWAWWSEAKQNRPSRDELDQIAQTLGGEALTKFEEEKKSNPNRAYFHLLLATRPATFHTDKRDLDDVMEKLGLRESKRRPQPGFGWPTYGGGDRRGDHRRGDRDRGDRKDNDDRKDNSDDKPRRGRNGDVNRENND